MGSGPHGGSMAAPPVAALEDKVASAPTLYHRVVFLVGQSSNARSDVLATLAGNHKWPVVNLGLAFSQQLLDVPRRHRATTAPQVLADLLGGVSGDVLLLDHIEVLFTPELAQDPVRLLQGLSRNRTLVVSWPGVRNGTTLVYAEPGHPEYYKQPIAELVYVEISGAEQATQVQ
jgi:hypothetical protein